MGHPRIGDEDMGSAVPEFIDSSKLFDSVFELADTWCPDIDEYEYAEFLGTLKDKLHGGF